MLRTLGPICKNLTEDISETWNVLLDLCIFFYLGRVCGRDDPRAVGVVVVLDGIVWRRDDAARPSHLTSAHRRCKERHTITVTPTHNINNLCHDRRTKQRKMNLS